VDVVSEHAALVHEREALVGVQVVARPREQAGNDLDLVRVLVEVARTAASRRRSAAGPGRATCAISAALES
jgi:hypothetical protein